MIDGYSLPPGWCWARLEDVAEYVTSGSRDWSQFYSDSDDGALFVRTENIKTNALDFHDIARVLLPATVEGKRTLLRPSDILMTITGANVGRCAIVPDGIPEAYVSQSVALVRLQVPGLANFVHLGALAIFRGHKTELEHMAYGIGRPVLNLDNVRRLPLPLAPKGEQDRIAQSIESYWTRLDDAVATLERLQRKLERYRASVLKAAVEGRLVPTEAALARAEKRDFEPADVLLKRTLAERRRRWEEAELAKLQAAGKSPKDDKWKAKYEEPKLPDTKDLPDLPEGWCWASWAQLGFSQNGRAFPSSRYQSNGVRLLRPGNLHESGRVVWTEKNSRCLPVAWEAKYPSHVVGPNELVINLTAQSLADDFLGRVCLTSEGEHCLLNQRIARLSPVGGAARFFLWMFKSPLFRKFVSSLNTGSLIQHMFTSQLETFAVPLPPLREQHRIADEVERLNTIGEQATAAADLNERRCGRLRQAILKWAFEGKLVDQDRNDEPAEGLLERIRAHANTETPKRTRRAGKVQ
jgi:type I restriction enzyme S subunit